MSRRFAVIVLCLGVCPLIGWNCAGTDLVNLPGDTAVAGGSATDPSDGATDTGSGTNDPNGGAYFRIDAPAVLGNLIVSQASNVSVECYAADTCGTVQSVEADLTAIGGDARLALTHQEGDRWSWTGTVTPPASGPFLVKLTANDDQGSTITGDVPTYVGTVVVNPDPDGGSGDPPAPTPTPTQLRWGSLCVGKTFSGDLVQGQLGEIKVACGIVAGDAGPAMGVTVDLGEIGGSVGTPVAKDTAGDLAGGFTSWYQVYRLTPYYSGTKHVVLHAWDSAGNIITTTCEIIVYPAN